MVDSIRVRDEILEVLYWLRGEGIHDAVRAEDLEPFLGIEPGVAREHLAALAAAGLLELVPVPEEGDDEADAYGLTDRGSREAGRRFVESFSPLLAQGHGTACAPDCECQDPARPDADCPTHGSHTHAS